MTDARAAVSAAELVTARQEIAAWLAHARALRLKRPEAGPRSCHETLHILGYAVRRDGIAPLPRATRKLRKMLAKWVWSGNPGREHVARSLAARVGNLLP